VQQVQDPLRTRPSRKLRRGRSPVRVVALIADRLDADRPDEPPDAAASVTIGVYDDNGGSTLVD
jgi:hypothetical protein